MKQRQEQNNSVGALRSAVIQTCFGAGFVHRKEKAKNARKWTIPESLKKAYQ